MPPVLPLRHSLDAPIGELSVSLGSEGTHAFPESLRGKCCAPLRELTEEQQRELLRLIATLVEDEATPKSTDLVTTHRHLVAEGIGAHVLPCLPATRPWKTASE